MPSRSSPLFGLELLDYFSRVRLLFTENIEGRKTGIESAMRSQLSVLLSKSLTHDVNSDKKELTVYPEMYIPSIYQQQSSATSRI